MKENKESVLSIAQLPARSEKLSSDQIQNVFGGCGQKGDSCDKSSDCCGNLSCYNVPFVGGSCGEQRNPGGIAL